ncbi:MFS transporter [Serratia marcescens]|uniref:MFS transporter n=2 Tax=Serratia TaxID=613 RepID=A0A0G3SHY6_SERMA|nr:MULTISPECIES: MFS transporter [Serratia]AKL39870.1 MFS transporter [Serratia marcescens]AUY14495.1 MFS transporter [Serratia sp. SSNIH1]AWL67098.1 MFS transporter [Serratia marcescens]EGT0503732.1 multidrug efflux MFS transporter [Serratia marcescens]EHT9830126.1 MFS transporter [Serratia marcescens]
MRVTGSVTFIVQFLFIVQLLSMGAMEMSGPFWPLHLESMTSTELLSIAGTGVYIAPMLGVMLTSTFWGRVGDKTGNKVMMIRALMGLALTQLGLAFANEVWLVLILRFLQGTCAGYIAPAQAYGIAMVPAAQRTRLFAWLQVSTNAGSLAGAIIGGAILDLLSFFWINVSAFIICTLCALIVLFILPADAPHEVSSTSAVHSKDKKRTPTGINNGVIVGLLTVLGLLLMSRMITQTPFSLYVSTVFNAPNWLTGLAYGLQATGVIVSASLWARLFEAHDIASTLYRMVGVIMGCILVTLLLATVRETLWFIGLYFLWGILLGATTPVLTALISRTTAEGMQGYILGVVQSISQFASIAGIALGGVVLLWPGLSALFLCVAVMYSMTLIITLKISRSSREFNKKIGYEK